MISAAGLTDIGFVRERNEDGIMVDLQNRFFLVADGMGGQQNGELASQLALTTVSQYLRSNGNREEIGWPIDYEMGKRHSQSRVATAIRLANRTVWKESAKGEEFVGMGTTVVVALVDDGNLATIGAVGDSRAYLFRSNALTQLTRDDTIVSSLLAARAITAFEAKSHPMRNVLLEAIGVKESVAAQVMDLPLEDGDKLLLCSDGLHSVVPDSVISATIASGPDPETTVVQLIALARSAGGPDNISCILIEHRQ